MPQKTLDGEIVEAKYYSFDPKTQKYVFKTKEKFGKNLNFTHLVVDEMLKLYSNFDGNPHTAKEIQHKTGIPSDYVNFVMKALGKTHDSIPFTDEDIEDQDEEILVDKMGVFKKTSIKRKFDVNDQKSVKEDAEKWNKFEFGILNPFEEFLKKWIPPVLPAFKASVKTNATSDKVFTVALTDLHFGSASNARYMFNKPDWNTKKTVDAVDRYSKEIVAEAKSRNYKFQKCAILSLGDQIHSALGKTARGTELQYDCIKEEQFDYALTSLLTFITRMADSFGVVDVHDVGGNHHYELDIALFRALEMAFRMDKRVTFYHYATRPAAFKIGKTLLMVDHGADSKERVYIPTGTKLEKHVQTILINNSHLLHDTKSRIFLVGDKHHFEHLEFGSFEFIMFSTILGSDEHASVNNWHNRARQSCLILDDSGLRETIHVYFD